MQKGGLTGPEGHKPVRRRQRGNADLLSRLCTPNCDSDRVRGITHLHLAGGKRYCSAPVLAMHAD